MKLKWFGIVFDKLINMPEETLGELLDVVENEIGEYKLDENARKEAKEQLGTDDGTAEKWETIRDVLKHIDSVELAKKYPGTTKKAVNTVLSIVGCFFPVVLAADAVVAEMPDSIVSKLVQIAGSATPEHLLHKASDLMAKTFRKKNGEKMLDAPEEIPQLPPVEDKRRTLIIVCDDELLSEQAKNFIDCCEDDGEFRVLTLNKKSWASCGSIATGAEKVLFIGDVKGTQELREKMEVRFDKYGVRYGWDETTAFITADGKAIADKEIYEDFVQEINSLPAPEKLKKAQKAKLNILSVGKAVLLPPLLIKDHFDRVDGRDRQQFFYGIYNFCIMDVDRFMKK